MKESFGLCATLSSCGATLSAHAILAWPRPHYFSSSLHAGVDSIVRPICPLGKFALRGRPRPPRKLISAHPISNCIDIVMLVSSAHLFTCQLSVCLVSLHDHALGWPRPPMLDSFVSLLSHYHRQVFDLHFSSICLLPFLRHLFRYLRTCSDIHTQTSGWPRPPMLHSIVFVSCTHPWSKTY